MLEIIFFIEEQLGVKVKDEEMIPDNLDSVNRIADVRGVAPQGRLSTIDDEPGGEAAEHARSNAAAPALAWNQARWTYGDLAAARSAVRDALVARGLARGDRVALLMRNSPQYVAALYGTFAAGGVAVRAQRARARRSADAADHT